MPQGEKSNYPEKQNRQVEHIETDFEARGVPEGDVGPRAGATVNKETGENKKSGSGRAKPKTREVLANA